MEERRITAEHMERFEQYLRREERGRGPLKNICGTCVS